MQCPVQRQLVLLDVNILNALFFGGNAKNIYFCIKTWKPILVPLTSFFINLHNKLHYILLHTNILIILIIMTLEYYNVIIW